LTTSPSPYPVRHRGPFLGQFLAANGDRAGARKAFEAAKTAKPGLVTADLALAELDTIDGKPDDARTRLTAIVSTNPTYLPGHLLFAQLEMNEGENAAAIEQFRKAVELDHKNPIALNGLAYLLAENHQPDEALKYAQKAKKLAPDNAAVADTRMDALPEGPVFHGRDESAGHEHQGEHRSPEIPSGDGLLQSRRPETGPCVAGRGAENGPNPARSADGPTGLLDRPQLKGSSCQTK
jgi:tetratricopeptide (TPR) repeat protein